MYTGELMITYTRRAYTTVEQVLSLDWQRGGVILVVDFEGVVKKQKGEEKKHWKENAV